MAIRIPSDPVSHKLYIGDSVYVNHDGHYVILTTENNEPNDPSNIIYLEPDVIRQLQDYLKEVYNGLSKM